MSRQLCASRSDWPGFAVACYARRHDSNHRDPHFRNSNRSQLFVQAATALLVYCGRFPLEMGACM